MPACDSMTRVLPFLTSFSTRDRRSAERALAQQEEAGRKSSEARGKRADEAVEDLRRQLRDLLGASSYAELRAGLKRERLAFDDLWQPPVDLSRDFAKEKRASKRKADVLLRKLGTSPEKLRPIGSEFQERLEGILSDSDGRVGPGYHLAKNFDKWTSLSPLHRFPLPVGNPAATRAI